MPHDNTPHNDNRRDFLRAMSAAGILGLAGFSGTAGAATTDRQIVEVAGDERENLVDTAKRSDDYQLLETELSGRSNTVEDDATVRSVVEADGSSYDIVSFTVDDGRSDTVGDLAVTVRNGSVVTATAAIATMEDGVPVELHGFEIDTSGIFDDVEDDIIDIPGTIIDDVLDFFYGPCDLCKDIIGVVCAVGCGAGFAAICAALGVSVIGGIACSAVAAAVCYFIGTYGCSPGADYICSELGYC